jgi:acyl-coenzyme A synthetase/AMP-(fatty) acid ligase
VSLSEALREALSREPGRAALCREKEALDRAGLEARIDARAEEIARETPRALFSLDASDPMRLAVDFFAARRQGRTAVLHGEAVPERLKREREERLDGRIPLRSSETVFFSSGSVSRGKAIPLSEEQLLFSALAYPERTGIRAGDRVAVAVPVGQVFGFLRGIVNSLLVGAEVLFYAPRRDPLGEADRLGATFVLLSPAQARLSAHASGRLRLRGALTAGGPVAEAGVGRLEADRAVPLRFGYGLTETTALGSRQHFDRPRRPGSSGLPAPGLRIEIVAPDGSTVPAGETGEIRISGPSVFRGYADPAEPSPFDSAGRLRTGDLGFLDEAGELHVRGREAASLHVGGRILCAEEIEGVALEQAGVSEAAAVPLGETFGLLVVTEEDSEGFLRIVREYLKTRLPLFARPKRLRRVDSLPRAPGGKLDRNAAARCFETP